MFFKEPLPKIINKITPSIGAFGYNVQRNINQFETSMRGSTFCIEKRGYFLTCKHVYDRIPDYAKNSIKIWLFDKNAESSENYPAFDADLIISNPEFDFVLLKIKNCPLPLTPLNLGDSNKVIRGQDVIFSGFPGITMEAAPDTGIRITFATRKCILSSIKRKTDGSIFYFLFDTECNEGFSGSPLIDLKNNKVIGYVARRFRQISQKADDIDKPAIFGWAYPINPVKEILRTL